MFAAISGLKTHQVMLDVTANDLANVNTIGYKASRTTFKDQLAELQRGASGAGANLGGANGAQIGFGVSLGSIVNLMTSGALQSTGNPLDVAIQGEGWFRVAQGAPAASPPPPPAAPQLVPAGTQFAYTRAGNFTTNANGYLMTQDGYFVVGRTATGTGGTDQFLWIEPGSSNLQVGQDGSVRYTDPSGAQQVAGYISLSKFANEAGLERNGGSRWMTSANSGTEQVSTPGGDYGLTTGGALEMSNVDMAQEFTNMITAQRGFQANSRVISTADDMLQELVNLKR
jgi:flagellar hook protein FlgE